MVREAAEEALDRLVHRGVGAVAAAAAGASVDQVGSCQPAGNSPVMRE